jgi:hypothetical protein
MTLAFSKKLQMSSGGKKMHIYEITHDYATIAVSASDLEMNYIDYAITVPVTIPTSTAGNHFPVLETAGPSTTVSYQDKLSSGVVTAIQAWGW